MDWDDLDANDVSNGIDEWDGELMCFKLVAIIFSLSKLFSVCCCEAFIKSGKGAIVVSARQLWNFKLNVRLKMKEEKKILSALLSRATKCFH